MSSLERVIFPAAASQAFLGDTAHLVLQVQGTPRRTSVCLTLGMGSTSGTREVPAPWWRSVEPGGAAGRAARAVPLSHLQPPRHSEPQLRGMQGRPARASQPQPLADACEKPVAGRVWIV